MNETLKATCDFIREMSHHPLSKRVACCEVGDSIGVEAFERIAEGGK